MDGQIWALKADSLTSPLVVTVTVTVTGAGINDLIAFLQILRLPVKRFRRGGHYCRLLHCRSLAPITASYCRRICDLQHNMLMFIFINHRYWKLCATYCLVMRQLHMAHPCHARVLHGSIMCFRRTCARMRVKSEITFRPFPCYEECADDDNNWIVIWHSSIQICFAASQNDDANNITVSERASSSSRRRGRPFAPVRLGPTGHCRRGRVPRRLGGPLARCRCKQYYTAAGGDDDVLSATCR